MSEYFSKPRFFGTNVEVELNLSNYATKANLKNATWVDTSLPHPPASQTLRHSPGDYCRGLISAHS